jgi:hypothetical protein
LIQKIQPRLIQQLIKTSLGLWVKSDPKALQAPVFEEDEPEEFIAYAENSPGNLVAKASALLYLTYAGRKAGESFMI